MVFLDRTFTISNHKLSTGKWLRGFRMGSHFYERGRHIGNTVIVETPSDVGQRLTAGFHAELDFQVHRDRVWLERSNSTRLCLLLSSRAPAATTDEQWTHGMVGTIRVPKSQKTVCATQLHAGRRQFEVNSRWEEAVINARVGDAFLLSWTDQKTSQTWQRIIYVHSLRQVIACERKDFCTILKSHGIDVAELPFTVSCNAEAAETTLDRTQWKKL